jgi:hypothetical protein
MISQSAIYCGSANEGRGRGCIRVRSARCERRRADLRPAVLLIFVPYHGHGHSPFLRRAPRRFAFITRRLRRREPPRRAVRYGRQRLSARVPTRAPYLPIAHRHVDHGLSSVMQPPGLTSRIAGTARNPIEHPSSDVSVSSAIACHGDNVAHRSTLMPSLELRNVQQNPSQTRLLPLCERSRDPCRRPIPRSIPSLLALGRRAAPHDVVVELVDLGTLPALCLGRTGAGLLGLALLDILGARLVMAHGIERQVPRRRV